MAIQSSKSLNYKQHSLSQAEIDRYKRQIILPELGVHGQEKLKQSKVLVVGAGGLGSPILLYLAAAGVGTLGIVDNDIVDISNLQRQILYATAEVGQAKVSVASSKVVALNPQINIIKHECKLDYNNVLELISTYDVVIDASDNFTTRYLLNDTCVIQNKPLISAAIFQFEGQLAVFNYQANGNSQASACYRCLYPSPPPLELVPNCAIGGVIGILPGIIGSLQANEAIKLITGIGELLANKLLMVDALSNTYKTLKFKKNPQCVMCFEQSEKQLFSKQTYEANQQCDIEIKDDSVDNIPEISVIKLKEMIDQKIELQLIDVRESHEYAISHINGLSIPLSQIKSDIDGILPQINADKRIVVHCLGGGAQ